MGDLVGSGRCHPGPRRFSPLICLDRPRVPVSHDTALAFGGTSLALAAILALVVATQHSPRWAGVLWGNWLYLGVAAGALVLEVVTAMEGRGLRGRAMS